MRTALLITTYNRPNYLIECFDSLKRADLSQIQTILIVDDYSTYIKTIELINDFDIEGKEVIKYFKPQNKSIKDSLLYGYEFLFGHGIDIVINLDSDAVVANVFVEKILNLKNKYPHNIVSGFNCNTLNKNGTVRHQHLWKEDGCVFRASVGGINMCINREQYLKYVKPALNYTLEHAGNWDHLTCINSMADSLPVSVTVPSVVQHCGEISSMNHNAGGEPMDKADDFKPLHLPQITVIGADCNHLDQLIKAADITCKYIEFGAVKLLSSEPSDDPRVIKIPPITSKQAYNHFVIEHFADYVDTQFMLIIQGDGYPINAKAWDNDFLNYDLIGAVWWFYPEGEYRVGNGGCAIRSLKLMKAVQKDKNFVLRNDRCYDHVEDHNISRIYRYYLEKTYDIKFAPEELAEKFSVEYYGVKPPHNKYKGSFAFHGRLIDFSESDLEHKPY